LIPEVSITCDEDVPEPGEEGNVVGPGRNSPLNSRNTPSLINVGLFPRQMWNGRFRFIDTHSIDVNECEADLGFRFPAPEGDLFTRSLSTAQAHIPVTELVEMTGDVPDFTGEIEEASHLNPEIREALTTRIDFTPAYRTLFEDAYPADPNLQLSDNDPEVGPDDDLTYLAIADAMGHFQESLVMTNAPWDRYLAGDRSALSDAAKRGAIAFFTDGRCSSCHAGELFSDFANHNIGIPQVGPGTGRAQLRDPAYGGLTNWDFGLEEITTERSDRFEFPERAAHVVGARGGLDANGDGTVERSDTRALLRAARPRCAPWRSPRRAGSRTTPRASPCCGRCRATWPPPCPWSR
jgi:cytochrome c peroxidase